ncbi:MAG: insulinase family protein [Bacteroidota bacterium]|nr:insulinase family protein [Bacteroidota bacterium]
MKKIFFYIIVLSPVTLLAQVDRSKAPKPGPAPVIKIGKPATFTLANGLKVFVVQNAKLPRVSATLTIDREAIIEGDKAGMTEMAGQLLRRGTTSMKKAELDEAIDFLGATVSTSSNSVSGFSLTSNFDKVVSLMADIALHPAFPGDELEKIRKQTLSGLAQAKEDPETIASNVTSRLVYGKEHPYGEIETETTVKNVTTDDVKKYYSAYWKPNIAYLVFVGDISVEKAKQLAETNFGKWQKGEAPKPVYKMPSAAAKTFIAVVDRPASVQSNINLVAPVQLQPGAPDVIPARVTANLLGGGSSGRLFKNLREKYGFTYGAYASINSDKLIGNFTANAAVRNEKTDSAVGQFLYEFNRIRNTIPEANEINLAKNEMNGSFARSLENPATIANFALNIARYHLPENYYQDYLKNLAAVNAEVVKASALKYVPVNHLAIVIVGNAKEIAKGLGKYGEVKYYDKEGNEVKAPESKKADASVTGESIIRKCLEVSGGNALKDVKDVEVNGTVSVMGQSINYSQKYVLPGNFMQTLQMNGMVLQKQMAKSGTYAAMQQGMEQPLKDDDKEELDEEANLIAEAYYLNHPGYTFTVKGIEAVDGKDAYVVEIKSPKRVFTNYYDVASGLKVKMTQEAEGPQGKIMAQTFYKAYKTFNGVQLPVKMEVDQGPLKLNLEANDVKVNQGLTTTDWK